MKAIDEVKDEVTDDAGPSGLPLPFFLCVQLPWLTLLWTGSNASDALLDPNFFYSAITLFWVASFGILQSRHSENSWGKIRDRKYRLLFIAIMVITTSVVTIAPLVSDRVTSHKMMWMILVLVVVSATTGVVSIYKWPTKKEALTENSDGIEPRALPTRLK